MSQDHSELKNPDKRILPPGWLERYDRNQDSWYYVNTAEDPPRSTWEHPLGNPATPPPATYSPPAGIMRPEHANAHQKPVGDGDNQRHEHGYTPTDGRGGQANGYRDEKGGGGPYGYDHHSPNGAQRNYYQPMNNGPYSPHQQQGSGQYNNNYPPQHNDNQVHLYPPTPTPQQWAQSAGGYYGAAPPRYGEHYYGESHGAQTNYYNPQQQLHGVVHEEPHKKSGMGGMGGMGGVALGVGAGLVGGMLVENMIDDAVDDAYEDGFEDGFDAGDDD